MNDNVLSRAFADADRSYLAAKSSVSRATESLMAQGPAGMPAYRSDLLIANEQFRHFKNWAFAAIRPICQRIAAQPVRVGRIASGHKLGTKVAHDTEPLKSHPVLDLFADPNDLMTAWHLVYNIVASLEITGRALLWLPQKRAMWPIPINWVTGWDGGAKWTSFRVRGPYNAEEFKIPADECVYIHFPDPSDPHSAISPLSAAWASIDADEQIINCQASIFRRGIMPTSAVILGENPETKLRPRLSNAQQNQIIGAVRKRWSGSYNAGEPLILDSLIHDVKILTHNPKEMDFVKSGDAIKARIFQAFGVNAIVAGQIEGSNRASSDAADKHFADHCINPLIELISQSLTSWLRAVYGDPSLVVWLEPVIANDAEYSIQWATLLAQNACVTGDELRKLCPFELEDRKFPDPVAGGKPQPSGDNDQLAESLKMLDRSLKSLEGFDAGRAADSILSDVDGHDHGD